MYISSNNSPLAQLVREPNLRLLQYVIRKLWDRLPAELINDPSLQQRRLSNMFMFYSFDKILLSPKKHLTFMTVEL